MDFELKRSRDLNAVLKHANDLEIWKLRLSNLQYMHSICKDAEKKENLLQQLIDISNDIPELEVEKESCHVNIHNSHGGVSVNEKVEDNVVVLENWESDGESDFDEVVEPFVDIPMILEPSDNAQCDSMAWGMAP